MYETKIIETIDDVDQESWNSLVPNENLFFTHQWFKTIEESKIEKLLPRHILVFKEKKLIAIAPSYIQYEFPFCTVDDLCLGRTKKLIQRLGIKVSLLPSLVCFSPFSNFGGILFKTGISKSQALQVILKTMNEICKRDKLSSCVFLNIPKSNFLCKDLWYNGFHEALDQVAYLDIEWKNFENYLFSLKRKQRIEIRRQIRRNKKSGIKVEYISGLPLGLSQDLFRLYENVYYKYNDKVFPSNFFGILGRHYGGNLDLLLAKTAEGKTIAFALMLHNGFIGFEMGYGCDYEATRKNYTYFVLAYYEIIKKAIEKNLRRVYFGTMPYPIKARLGCKFENRYHFFKFCKNTYNIVWYLHKKFRFVQEILQRRL